MTEDQKFPIDDQQMLVLLSKYPFLKHNMFWVNNKEDIPVYSDDRENIEYNWYKIWDGTGWERLWKIYFMPRLFKAYDSWEQEKKDAFYIMDTKSKFGTLRIYTSFALPDDLEWILEWMSAFICEHCGKESIDEHGRQYIYQTRGWISNLCEDCLRGFFQSNIDLMEEYEVDKGIEGMKRYGDTFGYKRWIGNGFITKKFKYNEEHDWLVNYETTFDKEQQNEH
jgi:hypothetical protein